MSLKEIALELFCHFDEENKGYITQDQLLNGSIKEGPFSAFSEGEILSIFTLLDKENKGLITLSDFTDAFVSDNFCNDDNVDHDEERLNSGDEVYFVNNNRQHSLTRMASWECSEENYRTSSPQVFEYGSTESLPQITRDELYRPDSVGVLDRLNGSENEDDGCWWSRLKKMSGINRDDFKRRESLPSVINPLLVQKARMKLLGAKKWHSVDQGIDKFLIATNGFSLQFEIDNNLRNQMSKQNSKSNTSLVLSLKHLDKLPHKSHKKQRRKKRNGYTNNVFGSTESLVESVRCSSCASLRSDKYSSSEDLRLNRLPKKFLSHNNLNFVIKNRKRLPRHLTRSSLDQDLGSEDNSSDYESYANKKNSFLSTDNLSSANRNGFIISCENVSTPVDVSAENWETFLKRISGVSLFAGNPRLRYLWKQIGSYQHDLLHPLEGFLKGVVDEHKCVLTKCQDIEAMLNSKIEQHENELNDMYEEFDKTLNKELTEQERQFVDKEDTLRMELMKTIDFKEATFQETAMHALELSEKLEQCREELTACLELKAKSENRFQQALEEQFKTTMQLENILQENEDLKQQLSNSFQQAKELQDYIGQVTSTVNQEKDKYHNFIRKYEDLLEEKEFLEANVTNLSTENVELRNMNKSLAKKPEDSILNLNVNTPTAETKDHPPPVTSSPYKESVSRVLSLQDEMNAESAVQGEDDSNNCENTGNKTIQEELHDVLLKDKDTVTKNSSNQSFVSDGQVDENCMFETNTSVRFASTVQSEFKVILCGDANSGKTSVIHRICYDTFGSTRKQTMQMDCYTKQVPHGESNVQLALWDTVGQERFNSIPRSYYRKTDVVILLYDITNEKSFANIKQWLKTIKDCTDENILLLLIGNKLDLENNRTTNKVTGEHLATENDAVYLEVSAKSGENIHSLIHILSSTLVNQTDYVMIQNFFDISTVQKNKLRKHPCCK